MEAEIVAAMRAMAAEGLNRGATGNVSVRAGEGLLITASGVPANRLSAADVVPLPWDGPAAEGPRPSSEWRMHRDILADRAEFGAVVHAHPLAATALAAHGRGIPAFHYMVAMAGGPDIRCAAYATFGTEALSHAVLAALEGRRACLMAHHGMVACGRDLAAALALAREVESLAAQYLAAHILGPPPLLGEAEMAEALAKFAAGAGYGSS